MGPEVVIIGRNQNHRIDDTSQPMRLQGYEDAPPVVIEDDVFLGARVIILPGITIGKGAVIGAVVVGRDISNQKKIEKELTASKTNAED